jgi:hypothetical protein
MSEHIDKPASQEMIIASKIFVLREEKVILDVHLAELFGVETRVLKQAVKRNRDRFPADFLYELTEKEIELVVSQNVIPVKKYLGGDVPFAFTKNGVGMLSSVLKSKKAIIVYMAIMRTFTILRKLLSEHKDIINELSKIKQQVSEHDQNILLIFDYLKQLEESN